MLKPKEDTREYLAVILAHNLTVRPRASSSLARVEEGLTRALTASAPTLACPHRHVGAMTSRRAAADRLPLTIVHSGSTCNTRLGSAHTAQRAPTASPASCASCAAGLATRPAEHKQCRTNKPTNKQPNQQSKQIKQPNNQTNKQPNQQPNQPNKPNKSNNQTKKPTNNQINNQPNKQPNKQTNKPNKQPNQQPTKQTNNQPYKPNTARPPAGADTHRRRPAERVGARAAAAAAGAGAGAMGPIACAIASSGRGSPLPASGPAGGQRYTVPSGQSLPRGYTIPADSIRWPSGLFETVATAEGGRSHRSSKPRASHCRQFGASRGADDCMWHLVRCVSHLVRCNVASCTLHVARVNTGERTAGVECRMFAAFMLLAASCVLHVVWGSYKASCMLHVAC